MVRLRTFLCKVVGVVFSVAAGNLRAAPSCLCQVMKHRLVCPQVCLWAKKVR